MTESSEGRLSRLKDLYPYNEQVLDRVILHSIIPEKADKLVIISPGYDPNQHATATTRWAEELAKKNIGVIDPQYESDVLFWERASILSDIVEMYDPKKYKLAMRGVSLGAPVALSIAAECKQILALELKSPIALALSPLAT